MLDDDVGCAAHPLALGGWVEGVKGVEGVLDPEFCDTFGAGLKLLFSGNKKEAKIFRIDFTNDISNLFSIDCQSE